MFIYSITNKINNKQYIGQTIHSPEKRFDNHCKSKNTYIGNSIRKYGKENFILKIIEECNSINELNERELLWIIELKTLFPNGYNLRPGGNNSKPTEESKLKMSKASECKKHSKETKLKIGKIASISLKGKKKSQEHCLNIGKSKSKSIICLNNGIIYQSLTQAAKELSLGKSHICHVLKGRYNHANNYKFKYI